MYLASHRGDYLGGYRGDPGLFGSIWKGIKGVARIGGAIAPGPVGMVLRGISGPSRPVRPPPTTVPMPVAPTRGMRGSFDIRGRGGEYQTRGYEGSLSLTGPGGGAAGGCPKGYRPNKTSYYTRDGVFHPEGSKCVKYRYRNVANGKALKRAISRTAAFDKMVKNNRKALRALAKI